MSKTFLSRGLKQCPCCKLKMGEELFAYTSKLKTARDYAKCMGCKRERCTTTTCKLGTLHDK